MNLPPGVRSKTVKTDRLNMRYIESGPEDGVPVVMIHGNLSTGRFFEHLMPGAPAGYRLAQHPPRVIGVRLIGLGLRSKVRHHRLGNFGKEAVDLWTACPVDRRVVLID